MKPLLACLTCASSTLFCLLLFVLIYSNNHDLGIYFSSSNASRWPIVCPPHDLLDEPASCLKRKISLTSIDDHMLAGVDVFVNVEHNLLMIIGPIYNSGAAVTSDLNLQGMTIYPFWCEFKETNEVSMSNYDSLDEHRHTFVRTCHIPPLIRAKLDAAQTIQVRFGPVKPYVVVPNDASIPWISVCPHPYRCPIEKRQELQIQQPLFNSLGKSNFYYNLSACTMANSPDHLIEWIEFHRMMGFEHFFVYDNNPSQGSPITQVLQSLVEQRVVTLVAWPPFSQEESDILDHDWVMQQILANNHCIRKYGRLSKWLVVFDTDEFITPMGPFTFIPDVLDQALQKYDPGIVGFQVMNWFYVPHPGTCNMSRTDGVSREDLLLVQNYFRAPDAWRNDKQKVFIDTSRILHHSVHMLTSPRSQWMFDPITEMRMVHYKSADNPYEQYSDKFEQDCLMFKYVPELSKRVTAQESLNKIKLSQKDSKS